MIVTACKDTGFSGFSSRGVRTIAVGGVLRVASDRVGFTQHRTERRSNRQIVDRCARSSTSDSIVTGWFAGKRQ